MSNPTFRTGPIGYDAADVVKAFRLVTVTADGIAHATADGPVFGAIATDAAPAATEPITVAPSNAAVFYAPAVVPIEVDGDATAIAQGTNLFAAADGKVSTTGTVFVGVAARAGTGTTVKTLLTTPATSAGA